MAQILLNLWDPQAYERSLAAEGGIMWNPSKRCLGFWNEGKLWISESWYLSPFCWLPIWGANHLRNHGAEPWLSLLHWTWSRECCDFILDTSWREGSSGNQWFFSTFSRKEDRCSPIYFLRCHVPNTLPYVAPPLQLFVWFHALHCISWKKWAFAIGFWWSRCPGSRKRRVHNRPGLTWFEMCRGNHACTPWCFVLLRRKSETALSSSSRERCTILCLPPRWCRTTIQPCCSSMQAGMKDCCKDHTNLEQRLDLCIH